MAEGQTTPEDSFATVAENAPAMIWRGDAHGKCIYLNRAQREFWGVTLERLPHFNWSDTLLPEDAESVYGPFAHGMSTHSAFTCEARYRRADGAIRILRTLAEPQFTPAGVFSGMIGVNTDVTDERRAQEELRQSEARQRLLTSEMNHRVKNLLSTVISIAAQTGRAAPDVAAFNASFQARLRALAISHDLLLRDALDSADLREILEAELRPYAVDTARSLTLSGEPVRLAARNALGFALVVHELATNAAKYGAYSGHGALYVSWVLVAPDSVSLTWREEGGPPVTAPAKPGFGSRLIATVLQSDLAGEVSLDYAPEGLRARLRFRTSSVPIAS